LKISGLKVFTWVQIGERGGRFIGTSTGVHKSATIRKAGGHRRCNAETVMNVKGTPWRAVCDEPRVEEPTKVARVSPEEVSAGIPEQDPGLIKPTRMRLLKHDFLEHGFTEGCRGCRAILDGTEVKGHSEVCRKRMEDQDPGKRGRKIEKTKSLRSRV